jgi:hypothetical protein
MSKNVVDNLKKAKWTLAALFAAGYIQHRIFMDNLKVNYFGKDGKLKS